MSTILTIHRRNQPQLFDKYSSEIIKNREKTLCNNEVSYDFFYESIDIAEYLFVHLFNHEIRGFACVNFDNKPHRHLYINLICNAKFHNMKTRKNKSAIKLGGKHMIQKIISLGRKMKVKYIELSAIKNVITYYYTLGFTFKNNYKNLDAIMSELYNAQKEKDEIKREKILKKITGKYYDGFYNEHFQRNLGNEKNERRLYPIENDGIPMIYYIKPTSICKGKTMKKCKNINSCKIAKGRKRTYCRKKNNNI